VRRGLAEVRERAQRKVRVLSGWNARRNQLCGKRKMIPATTRRSVGEVVGKIILQVRL
jgi:hypothetical protein